MLAWRTHYTPPHTHIYMQRCIYIFVWLWHSLMVYFGDHVNKSFKYVIDWNIIHFHSVSRMSECFSFIMSWGLRSGMAKEPGRAVLPLPERPAWTPSAPVVVSSSDPISICCKQSCFRFQKNCLTFPQMVMLARIFKIYKCPSVCLSNCFSFLDLLVILQYHIVCILMLPYT